MVKKETKIQKNLRLKSDTASMITQAAQVLGVPESFFVENLVDQFGAKMLQDAIDSKTQFFLCPYDPRERPCKYREE